MPCTGCSSYQLTTLRVGDTDTLAVLQKHRVCKSAMMLVTYTGRRYWKACEDALKIGQSPKHKLTGQDSNRAKHFLSFVAPDLRDFFEDMVDLAEPRATRLTSEETDRTLMTSSTLFGSCHIVCQACLSSMLSPAWRTNRTIFIDPVLVQCERKQSLIEIYCIVL